MKKFFLIFVLTLPSWLSNVNAQSNIDLADLSRLMYVSRNLLVDIHGKDYPIISTIDSSLGKSFSIEWGITSISPDRLTFFGSNTSSGSFPVFYFVFLNKKNGEIVYELEKRSMIFRWQYQDRIFSGRYLVEDKNGSESLAGIGNESVYSNQTKMYRPMTHKEIVNFKRATGSIISGIKDAVEKRASKKLKEKLNLEGVDYYLQPFK